MSAGESSSPHSIEISNTAAQTTPKYNGGYGAAYTQRVLRPTAAVMTTSKGTGTVFLNYIMPPICLCVVDALNQIGDTLTGG